MKIDILGSNNLKLSCGNKKYLWDKMMKEVKIRRFTGPFKEIPFDNYIQSPVGLVPKHKPGEARLIFHLSHPRENSVNSNTSHEKCRVKYNDLDNAIKLCLKEGRFCFTAKSDMKSNLTDGKTYFFMDKCLPFGTSISCSHFQRVSDAIQHILKYRSKSEANNYLDNFLFIALLKAICNGQVQTFIDLSKEINFPLSMEKQ